MKRKEVVRASMMFQHPEDLLKYLSITYNGIFCLKNCSLYYIEWCLSAPPVASIFQSHPKLIGSQQEETWGTPTCQVRVLRCYALLIGLLKFWPFPDPCGPQPQMIRVLPGLHFCSSAMPENMAERMPERMPEDMPNKLYT